MTASSSPGGPTRGGGGVAGTERRLAPVSFSVSSGRCRKKTLNLVILYCWTETSQQSAGYEAPGWVKSGEQQHFFLFLFLLVC